MNEDIVVRRTTASDAAAIQRVARASWHAAYDETMGCETVTETVDAWFTEEKVIADVNRSERPFFVAERDGEVVGFVIGIPDEESGEFHLYRIYVHPDHWGAGVGTRLLDRFETELRNLNIDRVRLSVIEPNDGAIGFYESREFERVEETWDEQFDCGRYVYAKDI